MKRSETHEVRRSEKKKKRINQFTGVGMGTNGQCPWNEIRNERFLLSRQLRLCVLRLIA